MPRCCVTIFDPNDPTTVIAYCEVDAADPQAGFAAAEQAATSAYTDATGAPPDPQNIQQTQGRGRLKRNKIQSLQQ